ncbi:MAG: DUF4760 domain-containing protein [Candidatus Cloacimonadota bacterium]|nr:DUF4760 domain-containing protein [Candidatus Cloacimonadota bacterium]
MTQYEYITITVGTITLIILAIQLFMLHKTYKADHERRKKQSTIEYINSIRDKYKAVAKKLNTKFGERVINVDEIEQDDKKNIKEFLSIIEHLSVGILTDVYDFQILKRMSRRYFIRMYEKLQPYMNDARKKAGPNSQTIYCEFEELYKRLSASIHDNTGKIKNS